MDTFDLAGARRAAGEGRLLEWTVGCVMREGSANRPLRAILQGQRPVLSGPVLVELASLERIAGGEPGMKYSVPMEQWEREIAPLMERSREDSPPILTRYGNHVADGNHRVDAWTRQGHTHGWAIVWEDSDPRFKDWWTPFLPEDTPSFEVVDPSTVVGLLPEVPVEGTVFAAVSRGKAVGAFRLVPEFGGLTLRTMRVEEAWRGQRVGARMLRVARPLMDGSVTHCLAYPWLERFYGEVGFRRVEPSELPEGLRERFAGFDDEKGCVALRREP